MNTKLLFVLILFLGSLGQVMSDLYLPSLPAIAVGLHTSANLSQLTVTLFMAGCALSQLIYGPISDAIGRRKPLLAGITLCVISSIICVSATHISILIIGRLLQGIGAGAGMTLSRSILRDSFEGPTLAKFMSNLATATIFLMAAAPLLGGYIQHYFDWRVNFLVLLIYTILMLIGTFKFLPETNQHQHRDHLKPQTLKTNIKALFSSSTFLVINLCLFLAYGGIMAWLTAGPIVLQNFAGLTSIEYGWTAIGVAIIYASTSFSNGRLVIKYGAAKMMLIGLTSMTITSLLSLLLYLLFGVQWWAILIPVVLFIGSISLVYSNAVSIAMHPFAKIAGIAGSILGFAQILGGFTLSLCISLSSNTSQLPMDISFLACGGIALFIYVKFQWNKK